MYDTARFWKNIFQPLLGNLSKGHDLSSSPQGVLLFKIFFSSKSTHPINVYGSDLRANNLTLLYPVSVSEDPQDPFVETILL
jgi:hypothetical protein